MRDSFIMTQKFETAKQYWLSKLYPHPGEIKLITDLPRLKTTGCGDAQKGVVLDDDLTRQADQISKGNPLSLFVLLLSVFKILLFKMTGQEDIIVATPAYSPSNQEYNKFVVMRDFLSAGMTFKDVLMQVRETVAEGYRNQYFPIENLIEILQLPNDFSLFRVVLLLENIHGEEVTRKFLDKYENDITFSLRYEQGKLTGDIIYNADLFREETVERLWNWYIRIMEQVIRDKEMLLEKIRLITEKEREEILFEFNNTHRSYPVDQTLHGLFTDQCVKTPANTVIVAPGLDIAPTSPIPGSPKLKRLHLTYGELNRISDRLACRLRENGSGPGVIVGLLLDSSLEMVVTILGVLKTGGGYLPIDTASPEEKVRFVLKDSGAAILITDRGETLKDSGPTIIPPEPDGDTMYPCPGVGTAAEFPLEKVAPGEAAYVIYTSGTTGNPKGVIITHQNGVNTLVARKEIYGIDPQIMALQLFPYSFDGFITGFFTPVISGARVVLLSEEKRKDVMEIKSAILRHCVTHFICVPALFQALIEGLTARESSMLRLVTLAGDRIMPEIVRKAREKNAALEISNEYGVTECSVMSTINRNQERNETILVGKPVWNTRLYIVDKQNMILPVGIPGELCIAGVGVAAGYLNRPGLTAEKFDQDLWTYWDSHDKTFLEVSAPRRGETIKNIFKKVLTRRRQKMYRTGDLARWHPAGNIELLGRIDQQVKIRGFRIELEEIERQLLRHENIKEAVVTVKEDMRGDKHLAAYMVTHREFTVEEMRTFLSRYLPDYMVPAYMMRLEKIPVTVNGKVDTRALPVPRLSLETNFQPPCHETEHTLAEIWADVLGIEKEKIGIEANFFQLGGNSLKVTFLGAHIQKRFNIKITLSEIFNLPTIKQLAQYIGEAVKEKYIPIQAVENKEYYDLSPAQKRLYFLQQAYPGNIGYNIPLFVEMKGTFDIEHFNRTVGQLMKRHDSLRTSFISLEDRLVQRIHSDLEYGSEYYEIQEANGAGGVADLAASFVRPFDLARAPLFRLGIINTGGETFILMADMHHIICDGTSQHLLRREFTTLFEGNPLPPLGLQYKDYSEWLNHGNQRALIESQGDYWTGIFTGELPVLNLPTDNPRPAELNFAGAALGFLLEQEETALLQNIAKETDATLYMVLLSLLNILLAKLSGQEDIVVGTPLATRRHTEVEGIVGMFVNTLPMRNYPSGGKTFMEFLSELKQTTLRAFENQEYPFEELVGRIKANRETNRNPVFDVMFVLQNMDQYQFKMPGLKMEYYSMPNTTAKFDLTLSAVEKEHLLFLSFEYSTGILNKESIERFILYFKQILHCTASQPHGKISGIPIITDAEKRQILEEFNNTKTENPEAITLHELFIRRALTAPDNIALIGKEPGQSSPNNGTVAFITYGELNERSRQQALQLQAKGAGPGNIVAILADRTPETITGLLAILKSGAAYLPIDPAYPEERVKFILADSQAKMLISDRKDLGIGQEIIGTGPCPVPAYSLADCNPRRSAAYVIYTSGTTGRPKGVMIEHRSIVNTLLWRKSYYQMKPTDRILLFSSLSFDSSVEDIFTPLISGAALLLIKEKLLDPADIKSALKYHYITRFLTVPGLYRALIGEIYEHVTGLKSITLAGESFTLDLVEEHFEKLPHVRLVNEYGPTENSVCSTVYEFKPGAARVLIGKPIYNVTCYIVDENMGLCPVGVYGELLLSGPGISRGYLNNPDLTAEKFDLRWTGDSFRENRPLDPRKSFLLEQSPLYRTGDLARWMPNGHIEYIGRKDQQLKIRGYRIEAGEIEACLLKHEAIKTAVVIAGEEPGKGKNLLAYYESETNVEVPGLKEYLSGKLPYYMIPAYFVLLEKIPLTPHGKLDRKALPQPKTEPGHDYVAPSSDKEKLVAEAWKNVLGLQQVGIRDNLFEIGGNSMNVINISLQLKKLLGKGEIPLAKIFQYPTIAAFTRYLDEGDPASVNPAQKQEWHREAANVKNRLKQRRDRNK